jgi:GNAT superfamily N-acetyltransferase
LPANLLINLAFREAIPDDIPQIQIVRNAVKENVLSNSKLITNDDCADYLLNRGNGWVCELDGKIVGFAIADLADNNIWALFVDPVYEKQGIGRRLHDIMLDWYFFQGKNNVWLGTSPNTRAASFYKKAGWVEADIHGKGEIRFEMKSEYWLTMGQSNCEQGISIHAHRRHQANDNIMSCLELLRRLDPHRFSARRVRPQRRYCLRHRISPHSKWHRSWIRALEAADRLVLHLIVLLLQHPLHSTIIPYLNCCQVWTPPDFLRSPPSFSDNR